MARDMDFRRVAKAAKPVTNARRTQKSRTGWPLLLLVIGLGLAAVGLFATYYYDSPAPKEKTATEPAPPVANTNTSESSTDVFSAQNTTFKVKIYDSGAGEDIVDSTAKLLSDKGYSVEKLGKSQFTYDKTYVWYVKARSSEAQLIGALLEGRDVSYKESQNSGGFELLIYLGKS